MEEWTAEDAFDPKTAGRFVTKDSGERYVADSGYQRDVQTGKARWDLLMPPVVPYSAQMMTRFAELLARGAEKYGDSNWLLADTEEDLKRFKSSAFRHLMQWFSGEVDEDHGAAVMYNVMAYETIKWVMEHGE